MSVTTKSVQEWKCDFCGQSESIEWNDNRDEKPLKFSNWETVSVHRPYCTGANALICPSCRDRLVRFYDDIWKRGYVGKGDVDFKQVIMAYANMFYDLGDPKVLAHLKERKWDAL